MSKINTQDIASYAAVIVAVVALYVGWDQARIGRHQQHADVYPVIVTKSRFVVNTLEDGQSVRHLTLSVANAGVGPAFAETGHWKIGDTVINHASEVEKLFPEGLYALDQYQGQFSKFILAPGEQGIIWEVAWPNTAESQTLVNTFMEEFWKMELSICYCSLYERCWESTYNADSPRPKRVEQCLVE